MADGWEDDDDALGLLDDSSTSGGNGAWGDDDDDDDDDALAGLSDDDSSSAVEDPPTNSPSNTTPIATGAGTPNHPPPPKETVAAAAAVQSSTAEDPVMESENGWGDEDDVFFDDDDLDLNDDVPFAGIASVAKDPPVDQKLAPSVNPQSSIPAEPDQNVKNVSEGWGDDDDFLIDDSTTSSHHVDAPSQPPTHPTAASTAPPSTTPKLATHSAMLSELVHYIETLPAHTTSVQAVLDAEYNTVEKALELQAYYADRPQLLSYTIEKELPRMDYTLMYEGYEPITDKARIAHILSTDPMYTTTTNGTSSHLAARCANQSLLADILQVMTGNDRVVRPQYHAVAIATVCQFHILSPDTTQAVASFELSLPLPNGRWTIAVLRVAVVLDCSVQQPHHSPSVQFRLVDIAPTSTTQQQDASSSSSSSSPEWQANLHACAELLDTMAQDDDAMMNNRPMMMMMEQQSAPQQNFRDVFLQTQSRYLSVSANNAMVGMQSAWKDLDAATGLGSKLRTILPETVDLAQVEAEQEALARQHQQSQQSATSHRPTSILGGFVRTLAQSVALPEEDPSMYETTTVPLAAAAATPVAAPSLYRREGEEAPSPVVNAGTTMPSLYRREEAVAPPPSTAAAPSLYRREETTTPSQQQPAPTLYRREEEQMPSSTAESSFPKFYQETESVAPSPITEDSVPAFPKLYNIATPLSEEPKREGTVGTAPQKQLETSVEGWGDEDDIDVDDISEEEVGGDGPLVVTTAQAHGDPFVHDPVTDILPTRKRWIHPYPNAQRTLF